MLAVSGDKHKPPGYYPKKTRTDDCPDWHQSFSLCVLLASLALQLHVMTLTHTPHATCCSDAIDPRQSFLWVSMEEKSASGYRRTIGEASLHLGSMITTSPQPRRVIHLDNYDKNPPVVRLTLSWQAS